MPNSFSFIYQHASRHQPLQSAQFPVHQPVLLPAMTPAANRDTNRPTHRPTTPPQQLHSLPRAPITAPVPVHLLAAPRRAATLCTSRLLIPMVNATTHQNQWRDQRNTTFSISTTGRIKGKLGMERNQGRRRADRFSLLFSFIYIRSTSCVRNIDIARAVYQKKTRRITRNGFLAQGICNE